LEELDRYSIERSIQASSGLTILIAEDDEDSRSMMRTLLGGYLVVEARSGGEAVEAAFLKQPDLVLLDLELPVLDGLKVTHDLRRKDKTRGLPIVIFSGWDPAQRKHSALAAGCSEYLVKPIDFDSSDELLNRYVPLS
jgi:two-component system, cell cycle response regulator DivK